MLYFVIPLRSAASTTDWKEVQRLLAKTLGSVDNQLSKAFRCLIVCHEKPDSVELPKTCEIVEAPFNAPEIDLKNLGSEDSLFKMHSDKGRKLLFGLSIVRADPLAHVMFLDADDLVSNRLAQLVSNHSDCPGWYFNSGYRWNHQTPNLLFPRTNFHHECGSCHILNAKLLLFPELEDYSKDLSNYYVRRYVFHADLKDHVARLGFLLEPLPFAGAIYTFNKHNFFANHFRPKDSALKSLARIIVRASESTLHLEPNFPCPKPIENIGEPVLGLLLMTFPL